MQVIANTQQAQAWNGWEGEHWADNHTRYDAMLDAFNERLLDAAAIGAGDRVLDVGCGTGRIALLAARRAAEVVGVDISAPMLARARADAAGVGNVTFEQGDAQLHPFPDNGFDVVVSRGGVMFFGDLVAAFANLRRALTPGGRLAFVGPRSGGPDSDYARATAALAPLMREPSPAARGMGALVEEHRIREVLDAAGFADIAVAPLDAPMDYGRDAAEAAEFVLGQGPVRHNLSGVDAGVVAATRAELRAGLAAYETTEGVLIPGSVWLVTATA